MCPIYEYVCTKGCKQWEVLQKIKDPAITECPVCEQQTAQRLVSAGGFILKGGGFYKPTSTNG